MDVRKIDDEAAFASISHEWNTLLEQSRQGGPFLAHEWLLAWWRAFHGPEDRLMVLTCRDQRSGDLLGVLPAFETRAGVFARARVVRLLGDDRVGSTGLGAVLHPGSEQEAARCLVEWLGTPGRGWDVLDLRLMDSTSPVFPLLRALPAGSRSVSVDCHASPRVALPATWGGYLSERPGKRVRRAAGHGRRQMEKLGVRLETVREAGELAGALDDMLGLWEGRMREVVGPRFCSDGVCRAFFADVLPAWLSQGRLRLRFLVVDGRRIAVDLAFRHGETMRDLLAGFDAQWAKYSVSNILCTYVVEGAIDEGCTVFDLGLGDQPYKFEWGVTEVARFSDLRLYARTAAALARRTADASLAAGARVIEALPESVRPRLRRVGKSIRSLARGPRR